MRPNHGSFDGLYNATDFGYVNTSDTDYHNIGMYMFDQSMDRIIKLIMIKEVP